MSERAWAEPHVSRWLGLSFARFVREVWQERWHVSRASCGELAAAAAQEQAAWFEELLLRRRARLEAEQLRVVRGGQSLSEAEWFQLEAPRPIEPRDRGALRQRLQQGFTLAVQVDDRLALPVLAPVAVLSACFECMVHAVVYASPPAAQGFSWHHDQDDVFVFQLAGEKSWCLAQAEERWPVHARGYQDASQLTGIESLTLSAGDVLYLPRGVPHRAQAQRGGSVHLTVSTPRARQFQAQASALACALERHPQQELPLFDWDALAWREAQAAQWADWSAPRAASPSPGASSSTTSRRAREAHQAQPLDSLWQQVLGGGC